MRFLVVTILIGSVLSAQTAGPEQIFREAVAAQQRGDDQTAIAKYQALIKLRPEVAEVRANLGAGGIL